MVPKCTISNTNQDIGQLNFLMFCSYQKREFETQQGCNIQPENEIVSQWTTILRIIFQWGEIKVDQLASKLEESLYITKGQHYIFKLKKFLNGHVPYTAEIWWIYEPILLQLWWNKWPCSKPHKIRDIQKYSRKQQHKNKYINR